MIGPYFLKIVIKNIFLKYKEQQNCVFEIYYYYLNFMCFIFKNLRVKYVFLVLFVFFVLKNKN